MQDTEVKEIRKTIKESLSKNERSLPCTTINNALIILKNDPLFADNIRENTFRNRIELLGEMPWSRKSIDITDKDDIHIIYHFEKNYAYRSDKALKQAMVIVAAESEYHPVREYLDSLVWDKVPRIRGALHHFLGADESDYTYECLKLFMLGAISRIFDPGCKFEYMLCLVGGQGAGKSTFVRFMATFDQWFTDDIKKLDDDKVYEHLEGHWICEIAEMYAVINTRYNEATKAFLSKQYDNYRIPYALRAEDIPRQCVFVGTSNTTNFLPLDRSGNRRFLPVMCHADEAQTHILEDEDASRAYIEQMWAEAMEIYKAGNIKLKLPKEIEKNLVEYQSPFMQEDTWMGLITEWLENYTGNLVCSRMLYNEALEMPGNPKNSESRQIGEIMNMLPGWRAFQNPRRISAAYGKQRGWERLETNFGNKGTESNFVEAVQEEIPPEWLN